MYGGGGGGGEEEEEEEEEECVLKSGEYETFLSSPSTSTRVYITYPGKL